jgi:hypothetical protein
MRNDEGGIGRRMEKDLEERKKKELQFSKIQSKHEYTGCKKSI